MAIDFLIKDLAYNQQQNKLTIFGETEETQPTFVIRKRPNHRNFEFPLEMELPFLTAGNRYEITINLAELLQDSRLQQEDRLLVYMIANGEEILLDATQFKEYKFDHVYHEESVLKLVPYITQDCVIALYLKELDINPVIKNLQYKEGQLSCYIDTPGKDADRLRTKELSLMLKKRSQTDMRFHEEIIEVPALIKQPTGIDLQMDVSKALSIPNDDKEFCWDLYLKCYGEKPAANSCEFNLKVGEGTATSFSYAPLKANHFYQAKPFVTGDKRLALYVSDMPTKIVAEEVTDAEDHIKITFNSSLLQRSENSPLHVVVKRRSYVGSKFEYYDTVFFEVERADNSYCAWISKSSILHSHVLRIDETWDFFVRVKNEAGHTADLHIDVPQEKKENYNYFPVTGKQDKEFKAKLFVNGASRLSLYVADAQKLGKSPIKVAVLGTCFSRNAFNSGPYFNPGYKEMFNCVFTQFHSSLISLVSDPVELGDKNLNNIRPNDIEFVEMDHKKTFFDQLKQAQPDYFIIDLYSDASKSVIQFSENQFVSCSYMLEESDYVKHLEPEARLITHLDNAAYFELWKKAVHVFVEELTKIIPQERIILNKGRFTTTYLDKERQVKTFSDVEMINRNNYFWAKLDNYFLHIMPSVKTIDLTDTSYIGDINYPFGLSYSHYEKEYYKEFFNRLLKLVAIDEFNQ